MAKVKKTKNNSNGNTEIANRESQKLKNKSGLKSQRQEPKELRTSQTANRKGQIANRI
jgi:hypothetical protein